MRGQIICVGSTGFENTGSYKISYVMATASGANMEVILTDSNNIPFFHAKQATETTPVIVPMCGQEIKGIKCPTFANCERTIIGCEKILDAN